MAPQSKRADVVPSVPITQQHPAPKDLDQHIQNPGAPRANMTVDKEHPKGYPAYADRSVLQQHLTFFDPDNDGEIWPTDTYNAFRQLGFDPLLSFIAMPIIHGTFSYWSGSSWLPDPCFRIFLRNAHRTKHGSDSETYDTEGRFVPQKFEEVFTKYDKEGKGGLSLKDIQEMVKGNRNIMDPTGWVAEWLEWNVSYYLCAKETPRGKLLLKEDARHIIDGTIFEKLAREIREGRLKRASMFTAGLKEAKPQKAAAGMGQPRLRKED